MPLAAATVHTRPAAYKTRPSAHTSTLTPLSYPSPGHSESAEALSPAAARRHARHARGHHEVAEEERARPGHLFPSLSVSFCSSSSLCPKPLLCTVQVRRSRRRRLLAGRSCEEEAPGGTAAGAWNVAEPPQIRPRSPPTCPAAAACCSSPVSPGAPPTLSVPSSACVQGRVRRTTPERLRGLHGHVGHAKAWPARALLPLSFYFSFSPPPG
jgi:hypothetical protein